MACDPMHDGNAWLYDEKAKEGLRAGFDHRVFQSKKGERTAVMLSFWHCMKRDFIACKDVMDKKIP